MTLKKIVEELKTQGYDVEFYVRKDGSIRIYRINEQKFDVSRSRGNEVARAIAGKSLSPAKTAQLQTQRPPTFDKAVASALRKTQALFRAVGKESVGRVKRGRITAKQVRTRIAQVGEKRTLEELEQTQRYLKGLVEFDRWEGFKTNVIEFFNNSYLILRKLEITNVTDEIVRAMNSVNMDKLTNTAFQALIEIFYDLQVEVSGYDESAEYAARQMLHDLSELQ